MEQFEHHAVPAPATAISTTAADNDNLHSNLGRKVPEKLTLIEIRKPHNEELVRTHPSEELRTIDVYWIKDVSSGRIYRIADEFIFRLLIQTKGNLKVTHVRLALSITTGGSLYLWPVNLFPVLPWDYWTPSHITLASETWMVLYRYQSNCEVSVAAVSPAEPVWPSMSVAGVLEAAFGWRYTIDSFDDRLIRRLRASRDSK
ncbi:MAG: hypothetical protein M3O31_06040 [Acidobacteriota bacterium]|nr:hypothetical protein [Acidobacteriota bacterium]